MACIEDSRWFNGACKAGTRHALRESLDSESLKSREQRGMRQSLWSCVRTRFHIPRAAFTVAAAACKRDAFRHSLALSGLRSPGAYPLGPITFAGE